MGKDFGAFVPLQYLAFLRHSFHVGGADLKLYQYQERLPLQTGQKVATAKTSSDGAFDFGVLPEGPYFLHIASGKLEDGFDIEVTHSVRETDSVLIDISPIRPDCSGGHEFVVKNRT